VREAKNPEEAVSARLLSVLGAGDSRTMPSSARAATRVDGPAPGSLSSAFADAGSVTDDSRLRWSDVVPGWPDDVDLGPSRLPEPPPETRAVEDYSWTVEPPPDVTSPPLSGAGAFGSGTGRLSLFDPGRRGVKALAAVAVCVVVIAAFLAWRARPRVDPVAAPPVEAAATGEAPDGMAAAAGGPSRAAEVVVAVAGEVGRPGLVRLPPGARVADALAAAGGAKPGVDVAMLNPARKVVDGELILVGVPAPPGATPSVPVGGAPGPAGGLVNLNTATAAELDTLPGVGPVLAQRILDARTAQGGFTAVSDLRKVDGIGSSRYEQLKGLVTV
jgi:competence protein ComEA